jgi:cell wall-associated NlpC family hydrolase
MRLVAYFFALSLFASGLNIVEAKGINPTLIYPNYFIEYSPIYTAEIESALNEAINDRLGLPYLWAGTDDRGYDCSGFVWRVFQDAGINFDRTSTRILWERLPEATQEEYARFGTLVFFRGPQGLDHVGIVSDAHSFYHVSNSQGVTQSYFDGFDKYWRSRIIGYRRIFAPIRRRAAPGRR